MMSTKMVFAFNPNDSYGFDFNRMRRSTDILHSVCHVKHAIIVINKHIYSNQNRKSLYMTACCFFVVVIVVVVIFIIWFLTTYMMTFLF